MKRITFMLAASITASSLSAYGSSPIDGEKAETAPSPKPQTTCPVAGMEGKRIKSRLYVDYEGYRIYVCCNPCRKAVRKEPGKHLKILRDQGIAVEEVKPGGATSGNAGPSPGGQRR